MSGDLIYQDNDYITFLPYHTIEPLYFMARFNENGGTTTYDSRFGLEGNLMGNTAWESGKIDSGLSFDSNEGSGSANIDNSQFQNPQS
ncbi:hypothetical protein ES703_118787 [subsurface metagenome]